MHCIQETFHKQKLGKDKATHLLFSGVILEPLLITGPESKHTTEPVKINPLLLLSVHKACPCGWKNRMCLALKMSPGSPATGMRHKINCEEKCLSTFHWNWGEGEGNERHKERSMLLPHRRKTTSGFLIFWPLFKAALSWCCWSLAPSSKPVCITRLPLASL